MACKRSKKTPASVALLNPACRRCAFVTPSRLTPNSSISISRSLSPQQLTNQSIPQPHSNQSPSPLILAVGANSSSHAPPASPLCPEDSDPRKIAWHQLLGNPRHQIDVVSIIWRSHSIERLATPTCNVHGTKSGELGLWVAGWSACCGSNPGVKCDRWSWGTN